MLRQAVRAAAGCYYWRDGRFHQQIPPTAGTYCLVLMVDRQTSLRIGRLGEHLFLSGRYVYVGSARGPGGLCARLKHHLRPAEKPHWHIDWLRIASRVEDVYWAAGEAATECDWLRALLELPGALVPLRGFGSSDCSRGCPAHLLFFGTMEALPNWRRTFEDQLHTRLPGFVPDLGIYHCT